MAWRVNQSQLKKLWNGSKANSNVVASVPGDPRRCSAHPRRHSAHKEFFQEMGSALALSEAPQRARKALSREPEAQGREKQAQGRGHGVQSSAGALSQAQGRLTRPENCLPNIFKCIFRVKNTGPVLFLGYIYLYSSRPRGGRELL